MWDPWLNFFKTSCSCSVGNVNMCREGEQVFSWINDPISLFARYPASFPPLVYPSLILSYSCTLPFLLPFFPRPASPGRTEDWRVDWTVHGRKDWHQSISKDSHDNTFYPLFSVNKAAFLTLFLSPMVWGAQLKRTSPRYSLH